MGVRTDYFAPGAWAKLKSRSPQNRIANSPITARIVLTCSAKLAAASGTGLGIGDGDA